MRFRVEKVYLTDAEGRVVSVDRGSRVGEVEAVNLFEAIDKLTASDHATVIGDVLQMPGAHAIATIRSADGVYTLQLMPLEEGPGAGERPHIKGE